MDLPVRAARVLERLRADGHELRFEVTEICRSARFRLSVRYDGPGGEVRLGLLYSEDRDALETLRTRLARA